MLLKLKLRHFRLNICLTFSKGFGAHFLIKIFLIKKSVYFRHEDYRCNVRSNSQKYNEKEQILTKKVYKWRYFSISRVWGTFSILKVKSANFTHSVVLEYALGSLWCNKTYGYGSYRYVHHVSSKVIPVITFTILSCL